MADSPYLGPRPFSNTDGHIFFGRSAGVAHILRQLREHRFIFVVGPSGVGKTSLVRAGVVPKLAATETENWLTLAIRVGVDAGPNLTNALMSISSNDDETNIFTREPLDDALRQRDFEKFANLLQQHLQAREKNLALIIDQLEEVFRPSGNNEQAKDFVELLTVLARHQRISVIFTLRADFLGDCVRFPQLVEMINQSLYLVPMMSADELRQVIAEPALIRGVEVESNLIERLISDIGEADSDSLAALQYTLRRMWRRQTSRVLEASPVLTLSDYDGVGGFANALQTGAEEVYGDLILEERKIAEVIFKALSERDSFGRVTRRVDKIGDIAAIAGATINQTIAVIAKFRAEGFFGSFGGEPLEEYTAIEIGQPVLIRQWQRLKQWIDAEEASGQMYRRLRESTLLYERGQAALMTGPELAVILDWRNREQPSEVWARRYGGHFQKAMEYLDLSKQREEQTRLNRQDDLATRRDIFICYRRDDSFGYADTLYRRLIERLSNERIFMDRSIKPGADFNERIEEALKTCAILLAVIGNQWLTIVDKTGHRRLDNNDDYVVREISIASARQVSVIPVLFGNAKLPASDELPESIQFLSTRQARRVSHDNYDAELASLVDEIAALLEGRMNE